MNLRPYQIASVLAVRREWIEEKRKRTLLCLPTGTGKTIVFSEVAREQVLSGDKVLILAHRDELLQQAADKLEKSTGLLSALEKAQNSALGSNLPVTIGSVQSLCNPMRLGRFPVDYYQTIIVDEAHHALSDSYQTVLSHFPNANVLGVTATPDRGDKRGLCEYFDSIAYEYKMRDAVKDGYLVPIKAKLIGGKINNGKGIDLTNVKSQNGDLQAGGLGSAIDPFLEQIADELLEHIGSRKTVIFLPLISTAKKMCSFLQWKGIRAAEVNGQSADRKQILDDFDAGKYDVLCNAMLLTEGWDCPSVDCIVILRPTKIRSLYQQMVGRGTRLYPGKKDLLLLDFLWLSRKHDLCKSASLLAPDDEVAERIQQMIDDGDEVDLVDAELTAQKNIQEERENKITEEWSKRLGSDTYMFDPLGIVYYEPIAKWESEPLSEAQISMLEKYGVDISAVSCRGAAHQLISNLKGKPTIKMVKKLEGFGCVNVGKWTFQEASMLIEDIKKRGWKWTYRTPARAVVPPSLKKRQGRQAKCR